MNCSTNADHGEEVEGEPRGCAASVCGQKMSRSSPNHQDAVRTMYVVWREKESGNVKGRPHLEMRNDAGVSVCSKIKCSNSEKE